MRRKVSEGTDELSSQRLNATCATSFRNTNSTKMQQQKKRESSMRKKVSTICSHKEMVKRLAARLCSAGRPSYIGIPVKARMKLSSQRLKAACATSFRNTTSTKMQ